MSQLAKTLSAVSTKYKYAEIQPIDSFLEVKDNLRQVEYTEAIEYQMNATFTAKFIAVTPEEKRYMIPKVKQHILNGVFGEFRMPILQVKQALYERNFLEADKLLEKLWYQMFEEGL